MMVIGNRAVRYIYLKYPKCHRVQLHLLAFDAAAQPREERASQLILLQSLRPHEANAKGRIGRNRGESSAT